MRAYALRGLLVITALWLLGLSSGPAYAGGTVWAWGSNSNGQLGNNSTANTAFPVQVKGQGGIGVLSGITAIAGGDSHSLAVDNMGAAWAWGSNNSGQLGDGTFTDRHVPVKVVGLTGVIAVVGGFNHSLALKSDGTVWAWGGNGEGQLGIGTFSAPFVHPVQVKGPGCAGSPRSRQVRKTAWRFVALTVRCLPGGSTVLGNLATAPAARTAVSPFRY